MAKVAILGSLGADVKVNTTENGRSVLNFSVCENIPIKVNNEVQYVPQWYNVSYFTSSDKLAKHLLKGKKVFVAGNLRFSEFRNQTTKEVIKTNEVIADSIEPIEWVKSEDIVQNAASNALPTMPDNLPADFL